MNLTQFEKQVDEELAAKVDWDKELESLLDDIGASIAREFEIRGIKGIGTMGGRELFLAYAGQDVVKPQRLAYVERVGGRTLLKQGNLGNLKDGGKKPHYVIHDEITEAE